MHIDTLERIVAGWKPGTVLNLYHANGFTTLVESPERIELSKHDVHGTDVTGLAFALPLDQIVYAVVRDDKKKSGGR